MEKQNEQEASNAEIIFVVYFFVTLFVIALKLSGVLQLNWLIVLSPIWVPYVLIFLAFIVGFPIAIISMLGKRGYYR